MKLSHYDFHKTETAGMIVNRPRRRDQDKSILSQLVSRFNPFSFFTPKADVKTHAIPMTEYHSRERRREAFDMLWETLAYTFALVVVLFVVPILLLGML